MYFYKESKVNLFNMVKSGCYLIACFFCIAQASASIVQIDLTGTISNTYIFNVVDGNAQQESASQWNIDSGVSIGSKLNFNISFDTNMPSNWHQTDGVNTMDQYTGQGFSVGSSDFQATSPSSGVGVVNGLYSGWDQLSLGFAAPHNTGIEINFQNEIYYLVAASIMMLDESGTAFSDSNLPTDPAELDAFWLNNNEPSTYWNHLATFDLQFVKDPLANSIANGAWPNGEALYVIGYFDGAKLTHVEASEPAGLILLLIGAIGLFIRRTR
jgi:hypothetical protein